MVDINIGNVGELFVKRFDIACNKWLFQAILKARLCDNVNTAAGIKAVLEDTAKSSENKKDKNWYYVTSC